MDLSHNGRVALEHARAGRPVFPCHPTGPNAKTPMVASWKRWATTDEKRITAFWTRNPDALPAIDLGKAGLMVIDADNHGNGQDGMAALADILQANSYAIGSGPWVKSPHGVHLYFRPLPRCPLKNGCNRFPWGVEVKTAGGSIIAGGTRMPDGSEYVLHGQIEDAPPLPTFFHAFAGRLREEPQDAPRPTPSREEPRVVAYADAAFEQELKVLRWTQHGRNEQLNKSAFAIGQMVGAGWVGESEAVDGLRRAAIDNGYVGKDGMQAAMASIRSGLVAGKVNPRRMPPKENEVDSALRDRLRASFGAAGRAQPKFDDPDDWQPNDGAYENGSPADGANGASQQQEPKAADELLETIWASQWAGCTRPVREYLDARGMFPLGHVTILTSQGGDGKTLLSLQASVGCCATGTWLGAKIRRGKVIFYSAEEPIKEIQIRIDEIAEAEEVEVADLNGLGVIDLNKEVDASLVNADTKTGMIRLTKLFSRFENTIAATGPIAVFIDNRGQVVTGNENDRVVASLTIRALELLADRYRCAIVLLSHPSLSGITSGTGASGSTGWINTARSAVFLSRPKDGDDDVRMLENSKANYSKKGASVTLRWEAGRFVCTDPPPDPGAGILGKADKRERVFLALLRLHNERNLHVSASPGSKNYAPTLFAAHAKREGLVRRDFMQAMEALLTAGKIENRQVGAKWRNQFGLYNLQ